MNIDELNELIAGSDRKVNSKWLEDELLAIKLEDKADLFLSLRLMDKKFTNPDSSAVAYLLEITDEPPFRNPIVVKSGRIDPPDIDLDFEDSQRDVVKNYFHDKWKYTSSIATYGQFTSRGLIRDLGRAFCIPIPDINRVCKAFNSLDEFETSPDTKWFRDKYPEIPPTAKSFEGRIRQGSMHPAGVVVANKDLAKVLPLESRSKVGSKERMTVTAYDMDDCQILNLIKIDFLGLATLGVEHNCLDVIYQRTGVYPNLDDLTYDEPEIFDEFSKGHTVGIFQSEASSSTNLIKRMGIDSFKDLMVSNALVRPGPLMTVGRTYINRKKGVEPIEKVAPIIDEITADTFNVFIFQEQLMEALVRVGGFTWLEADKVRKIIGKKKDVSEFAIYEEKWMESASVQIGKLKAAKQWKDFEKFAGYAFNRAHAATYSMVSYENMWLKKHYPLEFMYGLLSTEGNKDKLSLYLMEAKRMGIELLLPDINSSEKDYAVEGEAIRFGIHSIKGVGEVAADQIISHRPYTSKDDFLSKIDKRKCNKTVVELLDKVHAFDSIGHESPFDVADYYLELLNFPVEFETGPDFGLEYVDLADIGESKLNIVRVIVKDVDRHPHFTRIILQDSSSVSSLYHDTGDIRENEIIIGVVSGSSLTGFTYEEEMQERLKYGYELQNFEKFLLGKTFEEVSKLYLHGIGGIEDEKALVVPLSVRHFKTKMDKPMCSLYMTDGDIIAKAVVFPNEYKRVGAWMQPHVPLVIKLHKDENSYIIEDVIPAKQLLTIKEGEKDINGYRQIG